MRDFSCRPDSHTEVCLPVLYFTTLDLFADFMWVVELFPFSTHNALRTYTCSKKKKKTPSTVGRALSPFTSSYRVGPCEADASCTRPLSLSLCLLYTSKETWEHESVVLTTTYAHTPNPYIQLTIIENKSPAALSKAAKKKKKYHIAHTRCARRGRERERRERREGEEGEGGEKQRSKMKKRTAATRIPAWSPTAVLTSRYRA